MVPSNISLHKYMCIYMYVPNSPYAPAVEKFHSNMVPQRFLYSTILYIYTHVLKGACTPAIERFQSTKILRWIIMQFTHTQHSIVGQTYNTFFFYNFPAGKVQSDGLVSSRAMLLSPELLFLGTKLLSLLLRHPTVGVRGKVVQLIVDDISTTDAGPDKTKG